ncbi:MAG: ABC transporter ATP-binding protein [Actinomycetota bacterium]
MTITVRGLEAGYTRGVNVLNGIDTDLKEGEVVTVIGPNGSGKSTLLKAVMGYLPFSTGSIEVDGRSVAGLSVHKRSIDHGIAYIPQVDNVFRPLTVRENLEVGGQHLDRVRRKERIAELMDTYPLLAKKIKARADSLSGGERQIVAIGRALMTNPKHLLLDEPSAGLSPALTTQVFEAIGQIAHRENVAILLVEQNAAQALEISDRAYVLVIGRVMMSGDAQEILANEEVRHLYLGGVPATHGATDGQARAEGKGGFDADLRSS